jgi:hypothetical protein
VHGADDHAPIDAVGDISRRQAEDEDRHEQREPGIAQHQRVAGQS